jgi:hypothetical protein
MFDVGDSLRDAFTDARRRLHDAQAAVAAANSGSATRSADAAMGQVAQSALFTEALINAEHARFEEIKAVAK